MIRNITFFALPFALLVAVPGCFAEPTADADEELQANSDDAERGAIGKADLYGLCMEIDIKYCGGQSSGNCWCDDQCEFYGDCCSDYQPTCVDDAPQCNPLLMCGQALTCVDGDLYPTTCGPANCDAPIGPCAPPPKNCGGFLGLTCDDGEYCFYEADLMCGAADHLGTCVPKPSDCSAAEPVCGCDGNDYASACDAAAAGVSVTECPPAPQCDPTLMCGMAITCVDGQWYPTTCGPANCDQPMGPCGS
jgi:hypothetical protein